MNREDIVRMAREAGGLPDPMVFIGAYERFAALVAAAEREACAKVCDELDTGYPEYFASEFAAFVREREGKK